MNRAAAQRPPPGQLAAASTEAKLSLLESLVTTDDAATTAQRAVEWLADHGLAKQALVVQLSEDAKSMSALGSHGVSRSAVEDFAVDTEERNHPLIRALLSPEPVSFAKGQRGQWLPLSGAVRAFPLRSRDRRRSDESAVGLLLASGWAQENDLLWFAEILGEKLVHQRANQIGAERRFAHERALFTSIINAVTDPILLTDLEGKLIIANARAEKLLISHEEESEGRRRAVALNNMLFSAALTTKTVDTQEEVEPARKELLLVDPTEGSDLLFELLSTPVIVESGEGGIVSVLRNVTDLGRATQEIGETTHRARRAEAEAQTERHRLDLVLDSVADPIVVTDAMGDIVLMNPPGEKLFTITPEADDEAHRRVRANDAHFSSFISNLLFIGDAQRWRGEISLVEPDTGAPMPVEAISGKVLNERGEISTIVTILHDRREAIERARLYEQLKEASAQLEKKVQEATGELAQQNELLRRQAVELEQASAAKSQFLANMSHEFRTPLNAILGYTNMLLQNVSGEITAPVRKHLTRIDSNGRHLLEIINEILDITRIEAGRMPLHVADVDIGEVIKEVFTELEPIISRKDKVEVTSEVSAKIPSVKTDRQKVKQIVVNLLSNALKFTPEGSIRVVANYERASGMLSVAVRDTGIGIDPKDHDKVFEDFKQVDNSSTRPYGGTGLGLSICRRLAKMLDGHITLDSDVGKGSVFTLFLPRRPRR